MEKVYHILETEKMREAKEKAITCTPTDEDNYVVISEGRIKRVCVGSSYAGCSCEYDYVSRDCKYDCVRELAGQMDSEDKAIVLAALEEAERRDCEDSISSDWKRVSPKSLTESKDNLLITVVRDESLPKEVLAYARYDKDAAVFEIPYKGDAKRFGWDSVCGKVTHWKPMPEPPTEG